MILLRKKAGKGRECKIPTRYRLSTISLPSRYYAENLDTVLMPSRYHLDTFRCSLCTRLKSAVSRLSDWYREGIEIVFRCSQMVSRSYQEFSSLSSLKSHNNIQKGCNSAAGAFGLAIASECALYRMLPWKIHKILPYFLASLAQNRVIFDSQRPTLPTLQKSHDRSRRCKLCQFLRSKK